MTGELVSVVIPCHNAGDFIADALANVLAQREPGRVAVEAIVVDDASTDASTDRVEAAARDTPGAIRLLRQPVNRGPGAARNLGLRQASGRFVCFLDADDRYVPGFFARALAHFRQRPSLAAIVTDIELVNCHREVEPAQRRLMVHSLPSNVMLRTSVAELLGGFPEDEVFRGKAAGEDCAFRILLTKMFETLFDEERCLNYLVKRGSHFDYFLDRTKVVNDEVVFLEQTEEELSPRYGEAMQRYEERCRLRLAAASGSRHAVHAPSLHFDEIEEFELLRSRFADVDGFLHPAEGYALYQLAKAGPSTGKIVEIGSFMGCSTCWLAAGTKAAGRRPVVAVDHFRGSPEHQPGGSHAVAAIAATGSTFPIFKENITKKAVADCVEIRIGSSAEVVANWSEPVRLLLIDGDHSLEETQADFQCWSPFVNSGGLVAFHDVGVWPGVTQFCEALIARGAWREVARVRSLRVVQRID